MRTTDLGTVLPALEGSAALAVSLAEAQAATATLAPRRTHAVTEPPGLARLLAVHQQAEADEQTALATERDRVARLDEAARAATSVREGADEALVAAKLHPGTADEAALVQASMRAGIEETASRTAHERAGAIVGDMERAVEADRAARREAELRLWLDHVRSEHAAALAELEPLSHQVGDLVLFLEELRLTEERYAAGLARVRDGSSHHMSSYQTLPQIPRAVERLRLVVPPARRR